MLATVALIAALGLVAQAAPSVLYDQRQEGGWNVRADLKNFVVLIVPEAAQLLRRPGAAPDATMHFVQAKTAPYHVDISKGGEQMQLLGAAEQCGPDMRRDAQGVCRPL